jgi:hypothetical protein
VIITESTRAAVYSHRKISRRIVKMRQFTPNRAGELEKLPFGFARLQMNRP